MRGGDGRPDCDSGHEPPHADPHHHLPTWIADIGARTTWRVMTMEGYGYLNHYARFWLQPPLGHGVHPNMSGVPQEPLLAISCHAPTGKRMGRCRYDRLKQTFDHPHSASHLISPLLLNEIYTTHFVVQLAYLNFLSKCLLDFAGISQNVAEMLINAD